MITVFSKMVKRKPVELSIINRIQLAIGLFSDNAKFYPNSIFLGRKEYAEAITAKDIDGAYIYKPMQGTFLGYRIYLVSIDSLLEVGF